jgi:hypothetical protein
MKGDENRALSQTFFAAQSLLRSKSGPHIPVRALAGPNVHRTFGCFRLAPGLRPSGALRATRRRIGRLPTARDGGVQKSHGADLCRF